MTEDRAMAPELIEKTCTPCRGGIPPLTAVEVGELHTQVPRWTVREDARAIERTFRFESFTKAFAFVQKVAELAEQEGHHPDVTFGWGYASISLQTKKIRGLHENDFIMAAKVDALAGNQPQDT
jgi:4a-hydroxytetrahydrobiopterin dehydratase